MSKIECKYKLIHIFIYSLLLKCLSFHLFYVVQLYSKNLSTNLLVNLYIIRLSEFLILFHLSIDYFSNHIQSGKSDIGTQQTIRIFGTINDEG